MGLSKAERDFHRRTAARCFNDAWEHLEKKASNDHNEERLLGLVHASRYHWGVVGTPVNHAVGDWLISRAYAALGQPDLSLRFASSCLTMCEQYGLSEVLCTAYEAIARAHAVADDPKPAREYLRKARQQLATLRLDREDRAVYLGQIRDTEKLSRG
jgi:tetratricopeptide (TPR) repeat protein